MAAENRRIEIVSLPKGELEEGHFALRTGAMPVAGDGEVLVKTLLMSLDAANRAWMQGATYRDPVLAGDVMPTFTVGRVVESNDPAVPVGSVVETEGVWADYLTAPAKAVKVVPDVEPLSHRISVQGIAGKTAYFGLLHVGRPEAGETIVVSAAAGSVGSLVGQIGKIRGCRVVGVAGGAEKCAWLVDELGFDAAVDYKAGNLFKDLKAACPDGIDVYFDNVGGKMLETVLFQMNLKGRVVCCGAISQYDTENAMGPRNLPGLVVVKRLRMEGFIAMDFPEHEARAEADLTAWMKAGKLKVVEDIVEGLENAPRALIGLLNGENRGKRMVRVASD
ncbi:MAG: NADP-dependent oxidoreductase [Pacificimonas sp.]|jgi:NADPH-dependent curcumin reductase CurA|nr:NADP-dependent oxidoreductase [Pacificimonas sp.]